MLELSLFGNLEIHKGSDLVSDLKSTKAKALLIYLAVTGQPHSRSTLAGLLWADKPEDKARMNLSQALSALRRYFGGHLNITRETVALRHDSGIKVDVTNFESILSHSKSKDDISALQEAVQLYQGDFLQDFFVRDAPEFNTWVMSERLRLCKKCLTALFALADHHAAQGAPGWPDAIKYLDRLLTIEPVEEKAHQQLIRLLALSGRQSAALRQFVECRDILKEQLDLEPSPATLGLVEQIRQGDIDPEEMLRNIKRRILPQGLPPLVTPLIGRRDNAEELCQRLTDPDIQLVTVTGMGGIGKTHLALYIAHQLEDAPEFPDGVLFVPLASVSTRSGLLSAIAETAGLSLASHRQPEEILLNHFGGKCCLLVLDNFEQLLPEGNLISRLLMSTPQSKLLITSRERLKLRKEWVLDLEGLSFPDIDHDPTLEYDAVRLFAERARQIYPDFSLEEEIEIIHKICRLACGVPLAIEQAASMLRGYQASEIANQIEEHLIALSTTMQDVPERHRSMRVVFDWSWQLLPEKEQTIFNGLSVFEGSFSPQAAESVTGVNRSILNSLADKSLLRMIAARGGNTRYQFHELVRQYASEKLHQSGEKYLHLVHKAHLEYYLALAQEGRQYFDTVQDKEWHAKLEPERGNLQEALRWAIDHQLTEYALRLNAALVSFWIYQSPAGEASKWLDPALSLPWENCPDSTLEARADALIVGGYAAIQISDLDLANARFEEGGDLLARLGDQRRLAWTLRGRGLIGLIRGNLEEAQKLIEESLTICIDDQNLYGMAWTLHELGNIELANLDLDNADKSLSRALGIFRQQGRELGIFHALISLGALSRKQGRWSEALVLYQEALAILQKTHYIQFVAQILEGMAHIALNKSSPESAVTFLGAAQARRDSIEATRWAHHEIEFQQNLSMSRDLLPTSVWSAAWDKGYNLPPHAVLELAEFLGRDLTEWNK